MYSDADIEEAVGAGVLSADAAAAFRAHVAEKRGTPVADEEQFRLITGFNDIFVTLAAGLVLTAVGWMIANWHVAAAGGAVAATSWGLAEYFTRMRRMALPSIFLLLTFVGGVFVVLMTMVSDSLMTFDWQGTTLPALAAAVAAWLHWRRFQVPITVAAGAGALVAAALGLVLASTFDHDPSLTKLILKPVMFVAGTAVFVWAMSLDLSDTTRRTRRSDIAFWLHLLAAPLIVHPVFSLTAGESSSDVLSSLTVVLVYVLFGAVSLAIDRRALLVSAAGYLFFAIYVLVGVAAPEFRHALAALVVGGTLLLLSAFWQGARALVLGAVPDAWRRRLPPGPH